MIHISIFDRLAHAWNAFIDQDERQNYRYSMGQVSSSPPDRTRLRLGNERSIISGVYTRLSIDVADVIMRHVRVDDNGRFKESIDSGLNRCLTIEANIDQAATAFRQDVALTLFDKGVIAVVPVDTTSNPSDPGLIDIKTMRVGEVIAWYPQHVLIDCYDDRSGKRKQIKLPKSVVAIIYNPLYSVMNEPNSTLQRLIRKLNLLDAVDEASSSGKLDIIIQLPYTIKSEARRAAADQRAKEIEVQLKGSKYGVAYTDGTEKITQLNRPAENNMLAQVEYLTKMLYGQLGLTEGIFTGTASEEEMLNYHNRTVAPVLVAITEGLKRTFITKTAMTQGQSVEYYRDPLKYVPMSKFGDLVDKLARNEIVSANEIRGAIGMRPSEDPKADMLINSNMPQPVAPLEAADLGELPAIPVSPGDIPISQLQLTQ